MKKARDLYQLLYESYLYRNGYLDYDPLWDDEDYCLIVIEFEKECLRLGIPFDYFGEW